MIQSLEIFSLRSDLTLLYKKKNLLILFALFIVHCLYDCSLPIFFQVLLALKKNC